MHNCQVTNLSDPSPTPAPGIFAMRRRVSSYDVGPDHRLTIPGLLRQLHDTAQAHAAGFGFGYRGLVERGLAWALVCIDLGFGASPPLGETGFEAATSVYNATGPLVLRDYRATDVEGRVFARGQSMWALIDLGTRHLAKASPALRATLTRIATDGLNDRRVARLPAWERTVGGGGADVRAHDCDFNGHLNNVAAVQWMLDGLYGLLAAPGDGQRSHRPLEEVRLSPKRLRVSYHQEALFGERLECAAHVGEREHRMELRGRDGRLVCNAVVAA